MFVPVTFELTILFAAFAAVFGMFILNGLPMPYHPVFNVPRFDRARQPGQVLPGDRGRRSEVRSAGDAGVPAGPRGEGSERCRRVAPRASCWGRSACWLQPAAARTCTISPSTARLRPSVFFTDGASARPRVEGTVARGTLQEDEAFFTGKVSNATVNELPFAIDEHVLDRGQERFNIYCSPCHGQTGSGDGMVVRRGYRAAAVVPHRPAAAGRRRVLLRRDDERVRRDAGLQGADRAAGSLGDRRVHPRAATEPARGGVRHRGRRSDEAATTRRRRARAREALRWKHTL